MADVRALDHGGTAARLSELDVADDGVLGEDGTAAGADGLGLLRHFEDGILATRSAQHARLLVRLCAEAGLLSENGGAARGGRAAAFSRREKLGAADGGQFHAALSAAISSSASLCEQSSRAGDKHRLCDEKSSLPRETRKTGASRALPGVGFLPSYVTSGRCLVRRDCLRARARASPHQSDKLPFVRDVFTRAGPSLSLGGITTASRPTVLSVRHVTLAICCD